MQRACMCVCVCGYLLFFLSLPAIQKCKMTVLHSLRFPHYLGSVWYAKCVCGCVAVVLKVASGLPSVRVCVCVFIFGILTLGPKH